MKINEFVLYNSSYYKIHLSIYINVFCKLFTMCFSIKYVRKKKDKERRSSCGMNLFISVCQWNCQSLTIIITTIHKPFPLDILA